jgi:hypothetical protein
MNGLDRHCLAQAVALLAPEAGEALIPKASRESLLQDAYCLPPLLDGVFEVELGEESNGVRILQRVAQASADVDVLQEYLANGSNNSFLGSIASSLSKLLATWKKPASPLYDWMQELWLEVADSLPDDSAPVRKGPFIQFGLAQSVTSVDDRWFATQAALDILMAKKWRTLRETLLRVMFACPPQAFVSQVGMPMGKEESARVQVKRLRPKTLAKYLRHLEWQGNISGTVSQAEKLLHFADHLSVCLTVGCEISPQLDFECHFNTHSATESRWGALLDELVGLGVCTASKRDAFLGWAGMTTPLHSAGAWPDRLIVESLAHPENHLSVIQRRYSHIKIFVAPGQPFRANGYLRYIPQWLKV